MTRKPAVPCTSAPPETSICRARPYRFQPGRTCRASPASAIAKAPRSTQSSLLPAARLRTRISRCPVDVPEVAVTPARLRLASRRRSPVRLTGATLSATSAHRPIRSPPWRTRTGMCWRSRYCAAPPCRRSTRPAPSRRPFRSRLPPMPVRRPFWSRPIPAKEQGSPSRAAGRPTHRTTGRKISG